MKRTVFTTSLTVTALAAALALSGCSANSDGAAPKSTSGTIPVVASTNVWGDVAKEIGGAQVAVTSIIDDPKKDPHTYQASGQNQLAVSKAEIVIVNGGGYDDFMGSMLATAHSSPVTLNVADISGYDQHPAGGVFNEHLWYDFPTVQKVAEKIAAAYSKARPQYKATFEANAKKFEASVAGLEESESALKQKFAGKGVAITEPVPLYMLEAIGLVNKTPEKFSEAIQNETDVAPATLQQTLDLFSTHAVALLVYNEQTTGAQTQQALDAARSNQVPVVPVTETLPAGKTYLGWMRANLDAIGAALQKAAS